MNSTTYLTLDLQAPNFAVMASAKQNDTLGRHIAATLRDGSASFDATGLLCEIRYAKPDGTVGFYDTLEDDETPAYSIDGNVVTFTLAEQMLTVAGAVYVDLNFYAATGEELTAFTFTLNEEAKAEKDRLQERDGFTPAQRFFLAYANVWAGNIRPEEILNRTKSDPHSLGRWRVNGALPQINAWYDAWNVTPESPMYIAPEERVSIW